MTGRAFDPDPRSPRRGGTSKNRTNLPCRKTSVRTFRTPSSTRVRKTKTPLTIFLVNGVKLQGIVTWFDNFCVLLRRDGQSQLVYKHAISTIMPSAARAAVRADADDETD